eukprot:COSAG02_NODE_25561_length_655_cov_0.784173_1_plen_43_part_10
MYTISQQCPPPLATPLRSGKHRSGKHLFFNDLFFNDTATTLNT